MIFAKVFTITLALGPPGSPRCAGPLTRAAVIECAKSASPRVRADHERVAVARGDADAARVVFPSNPVVSLTAGQRWNTTGQRALNVTGSISQRIEVAGARGKRRRVAAAEVTTREHEATVTERDVTAEALLAYYDVLAAREELEVLERGVATASRLAEVADGRASIGSGAGIEADLARADATALRERLALAKGRIAVSEAQLSSALGLDPGGPQPEVRGSLEPLSTPNGLADSIRSARQRPEVTAAQSQRQVEQARLGVLRRERVPAPSLSVFAQTDGFNERIVGGGISFPIPLPFPLGRTNRGEIRAAQARIREADERSAATTRMTTLEVATAHHELDARQEAADVYSESAQASARQTLEDLSGEIESGRVPVRDALLAQQSLLALLLRAVESQHQLCRASVELVLASGASFEGGAR